MQLFQHQSEAIRLGSKQSLALFHDCGTGKTRTAIELIKHNGGPALVLAPLSILESAWMEDIKRFSDLKAVNLHENRLAINRNADIYLINYDAARGMFKALREKLFNVMIVDESSKIKNPKSQITKLVLALSGFNLRGSSYQSDWIVPHRYCLSGTPAPNSELEYWPQVKCVTGPGNKGFNDNFYAFRNRYFRNIFQGKMTQAQKWLLKRTLEDNRDAKTDLITCMAPWVHVVRKEDALDLPDKVAEVRSIDLSKTEQDAYDQMEADCVLRFADEDVLAVNAISEIMKLRQLTSGFCYGEQGSYRTGSSKAEAMAEVLEEIGSHQVIIWANFIEETNFIRAALGDECRAVYGGCDDRDAAILAFKSGEAKYLVANPACAGHGLTFVNCSYAVYFSQDYSFELHKQSMDRIHRIGQVNKCTYIYLLARGTIDEVIHRAVNHKGEICGETLAWLRAKREGMPHAIKTA
jgi:SNF2 family DNA or RNA helicase